MTDSSKPHVVDVFPYNGEPIVARRLAYLDAVVDQFVVVEARTTHSGLVKPSLFVESHREVFAPYMHKIHFVILDTFPPMQREWKELKKPWVRDNVEHWWREGYQRDAVVPLLRGMHLKHPILALVCDCDEIPSREAIDALVESYEDVAARPAVHLTMALHYYDWTWTVNMPWTSAFAIAGGRLGPSLTEERHAGAAIAAVMPDAGWHASFFMSPEEVARKVKSFAHCEADTPLNTNVEEIERAMQFGKDVLHRVGMSLVPTPKHAMARIPEQLMNVCPIFRYLVLSGHDGHDAKTH